MKSMSSYNLHTYSCSHNPVLITVSADEFLATRVLLRVSAHSQATKLRLSLGLQYPWIAKYGFNTHNQGPYLTPLGHV